MKIDEGLGEEETMDVSRREFMAGAAACACACAMSGCVASSLPTFEAGADRTLPVPVELAKPGDQVKVKLPGSDAALIVVRTEIGFSATSIFCTHRGTEIHYNLKDKTLDCPLHGSRFKLDGSVVQGPAKEPLRSYVVELQGERLRILG
jgi:nitrite reductase/ring-hydroxylating ferredoxin subunit